ncbi:MAG: hypothetical protein IJS46_05510 [Kiritimatiellae bacterium]|nr:hypothetical protein [Kiritimatiellia bacterium]
MASLRRIGGEARKSAAGLRAFLRSAFMPTQRECNALAAFFVLVAAAVGAARFVFGK